MMLHETIAWTQNNIPIVVGVFLAIFGMKTGLGDALVDFLKEVGLPPFWQRPVAMGLLGAVGVAGTDIAFRIFARRKEDKAE